MRAWVSAVLVVGTLAPLVSCSSSAPSPNEITGSTRQADSSSPPAVQSTTRVCQLIGDTDYAARPAVVATKNRTNQRFGIRGTDEGSTIVDPDDGLIFFYFGDTNPDGNGYDTVAWTHDVQLPQGECPLLDFGAQYTDDSDERGAPVLTLDGQIEGIARAPNGGFYDGGSHRIYLFYNVFREQQSAPNPIGGRTVLAWADPSTPNELHSVGGSPFNGPNGLTTGNRATDPSQFLMVAPIVVSRSDVADIPFGNVAPDSKVLLVYGSTGPLRAGEMQLAAVPLAQVDDAQAYLYRTATGWSADHTLAAPVFTDQVACAGEATIMKDEATGKYLLAYVCGQAQTNSPYFQHGGPNEGVFLRTADGPVGPWSPPGVLFNDDRDGAIGRYVHDANPRVLRTGNAFERTLGDLCSIDDGKTYCCSEPITRGASDCANGKPYAAPVPNSQSYQCIDPNPAALPRPSCRLPSAQESSPTSAPGCCTVKGNCCDLAYTDETYDNLFTAAWGSSQAGYTYNPYFLPTYTRTVANVQGTSMPSGIEVYYDLSTWNPYVTDVIKSTVTFEDADGDTVPDDVDNCPLVANPDQANCNEEAELAYNTNNLGDQVGVLGDACDPVPCPAGDAQTPTGLKNVSCIPARRDPYVTQACTYLEIHDQIDLVPIGAHALSSSGATTKVSIEHPASNVATRGRFCQYASPRPGQLSINCTDEEFMSDAQLLLSKKAEDEQYDQKHPWHRITLKSQDGTFVSDRNETHFFTFDYGGGVKHSLRWDYADDYAFWTRIGAPQVIGSSNPTCSGTACLNGRLWFNGDSRVGSQTASASDGAPVGINGADMRARSLVDHYFDEQPEIPAFEKITGVGAIPRNRFILRDPGDPIERVGQEQPWNEFEKGNAVPIFLSGTSVLGLRQTSALVDASASFGPSFVRELDGSQPWANAPGPTTVDASRPMAVEISEDATSVLGSANLVGDKILFGQAVELVAQSGGADRQTFGGIATIVIPATIPTIAGNAGNGLTTLSFDVPSMDRSATSAANSPTFIPTSTVQCTYVGGASQSHPDDPDDRAHGANYIFASCDGGLTAGSQIKATAAYLHVLSGDSLSGTTRVESALTALETAGSALPRRDCDYGHGDSSGPRPRRNFVATYAPTLDGVFVVGGTSRWNEPLSDAWFKPLDRPWQQINLPPGTLGHVLDAAFSPADRRLWVLDEADSNARDVGHWSCHHKRTVRLLRIEHGRGSVEVVASAQPHGAFDRRGLLSDKDGQIMMWASNGRTNAHRVVRLVPNVNSFDAFATPSLAGSLSIPPVVDYRGYAFVANAPRTSQHTFQMDRVATLPLATASLSSWTELLQ